MSKKELKENDIVNYIIANWNKYFTNIKFYKKEYKLRDFRVDVLADISVNYKDLGLRDYDYIVNRAPVFFEFKFDSNMRDLMFEMQKQIKFRNWYIKYGKAFCMICVISDDFDDSMVEFLEKNDIKMFKINIKDNDLDTLEIEEYFSTKSRLDIYI